MLKDIAQRDRKATPPPHWCSSESATGAESNDASGRDNTFIKLTTLIHVSHCVDVLGGLGIYQVSASPLQEPVLIFKK